MTSDPFILNLVQGYQISFLSKPVQNYSPRMVQMDQDEVLLVDQEMQEMMRKGAIQTPVQSSSDQFLSSIFVIPRKDTGHHPVINLKKLNKYIPYEHLRMEGVFLLKEFLKKGDRMCKTDLSHAYFSEPLHPEFVSI